MVWSALGGAVIGGIAGYSGAVKARTNWRTQRTRIFNDLGRGRAAYERGMAGSISMYRDSLARAEELTQQRIGEINQAQIGAGLDINAVLQQQIAASRTGAGSVLAQSTGLNQQQRGFYSDAGRSLASVQSNFALARSNTLGAAGGQEINARNALAGALLGQGATRYKMWQDKANVWTGGPQQSGGLDLGGLMGLLSMFTAPAAQTQPAGGYQGLGQGKGLTL